MAQDIVLIYSAHFPNVSKKLLLLLLLLLSLIFASFKLNANAQKVNEPVSTSLTIEEQLADIETASPDAQRQVEAIVAQTTGENRIRVQLKLASIYRRSAQIEMAETLAQQLNANLDQASNALKIDILISAAQLENKKNNYAQCAALLIEKTLPFVDKNSPQLARIYRLAANCYRLNRNMDDAEKYYFLALEYYQKANNELEMARMYSSLGVFYESLDNLPLAAEYQLKAMKFFEKTNDLEDLASNYFNLGELYFRSEEYDKSLTFYQKALAYDKKLNDSEFIGYDYHRIGSIYLAQNKLAEAMVNTNKAIDIFSKGSFHQVLARAYVQQAQIFTKQANHEARLISLQKAEAAAVISEVEHQLRSVWHNLGVYYVDHLAYSDAQQYLEKSLAISTKLDLLKYRVDDNELLSTVYHHLGQDGAALKHLQTAYKLKQELNSEQRIKALEKHKRDINLLEEQLKVSKLEEESKQAEQAVTEQKELVEKITLLTFAVIVFFGFISYILFQRRKMAVISSKLYEDALLQKNQLLADVSHELRTPLTALKLQVDALRYHLVDDVELSYQKLSTKITDLSNLIGDIYELAVSDVYGLSINIEPVNIAAELSAWRTEFKQYVNAEKLKWRDDIAISDTFVKADKDRLKQVLSNLINNSVKYTDKPGCVELSAWLAHGQVNLCVQDSSPSVDEDELPKIFERLYRVEKSRNRSTGGSGLGLAICQNIIQAHNGTIYAKKSSLGGLAIYINLPLA